MSTHFKDLKWAGALVIQLYTRPVSRLTFARDVDKVSDFKVQFTAVFVCLLTLMLLGLLKVLPRKFNCIKGSFSEQLGFLSRELLSWCRGLLYAVFLVKIEVRLVAEFKLIRGKASGFMG